MSFISFIKRMFGINSAPQKPTEVDAIFSYLVTQTKSADVIENYLSKYKKLKNDSDGKFNPQFIRLYLSWEEYNISNQPTGSERVTADILRQKISEKIDLNKINDEMRLVFVNDREKALILYEKFIQHFATYVISNIGHDAFLKIVRESNPGSLFDQLKTNATGFDFSTFNSILIPNKREYPIVEITRLFKGFVSVFYNKIELSLGQEVAHSIFKKFFERISETYDAEIAAILLKVIPERVLGLNEWLSLLSKNELEKEVRLKTNALEDLNNSLEEKVRERTRALQQAYEELKVLDKKKSEFISVAAHQLRTPLSGIKWTMNMILNEELGKITPEQKDLLEKGYQTNEHMLSIINDMLNTDLIITGKAEYNFSKIFLCDIIDTVMNQISGLASEKSINVIREKIDKKQSEVDADPKKIELVVLNLIDNAIKYSPVGSSVTLNVTKSGNEVHLDITDSGIGIPEDQKNNIFDRFYRAPNAIRTQANGSGLGLFIAKNIIEKHNGKISFESTENKGTTFTVILPVKQN